MKDHSFDFRILNLTNSLLGISISLISIMIMWISWDVTKIKKTLEAAPKCQCKVK